MNLMLAPRGLSVLKSRVREEADMQRFRPGALALIAMLALFLSVLSVDSLGAQETSKKAANDRPGDETYTPTKIEWAVLDLQATYGNTNWTSETPVTISYVDSGDGKTVLCVLQYTPDVPATVVKINRDSAQRTFDKYSKSRQWPWLRLQFDERVIRHSPRQEN
jgi:hypothetical protein